MGNSQSDTPLIRLQMSLKDCFVSHCCMAASIETEEEAEQEAPRGTDEVDNINTSPEGGEVMQALAPLPSCQRKHRTQSL